MNTIVTLQDKIQSQKLYTFNKVLSHIYILFYSLEFDSYFSNLFDEIITDDVIFESYSRSKREHPLEQTYKEGFVRKLNELLKGYSYMNTTRTYQVLSYLVQKNLELIDSRDGRQFEKVGLDISLYLSRPLIKDFLEEKIRHLKALYDL